MCVSIETVIGVAMALIMNRAFRGRALIRASILVPWAIPTVVSAVLWKWIFNANGVANAVIGKQVLWSTDGFQAQMSVIIADTWKTAPFIGLLVLAGLQVIPAEVYEAAKIDGSSTWNSFLHITLPLVKPALLVAVLFRLLDTLRMFDLPYVLVGSGQAERRDAVDPGATREHQHQIRAGGGLRHAAVHLPGDHRLRLHQAARRRRDRGLGQEGSEGQGPAPVQDRPQRREGRHAMTTQAASAPGAPGTSVSDAPPPRKVKQATAGGDRARKYGVYAGITVIIVYCLAPFYWMIVTSLRRAAEVFDGTPLPTPPSVENYTAVFDPVNNFTRALVNSIIVAGVTTVAVLVIGTFAAYALARLEFRGKNLALSAIIATSMFPGIALVVPLLKIFTDIGWINTYQALILPSMSFALPLSVWNLTAFFRQMPVELEQAAMVDGCTQWQAFRKVIIPLAAPGVFTTAIIAFVAAWNEFIIALTMTNKSDFFTAVVAIAQFQGKTGRDIPVGSQMAAGVILTVPLLIMVLAFQRRIVSGLTAGGVK